LRAHPSHFPLVRTIAMVTVLLGVVGYELYPLAPPRLATGLLYQGHAFHFQNTAVQVIGTARLNGVPLGYNAYSAMPSLHFAMALIVAGCVLLLSSSLLTRTLAVLYPLLMLFTVIVSANHYVLDVAGGALIMALATLLALVLEPGHMHLARMLKAAGVGPIPSTARQPDRAVMAPRLQKGNAMSSFPGTTHFNPSLTREKLLEMRAEVLQRRDRTVIAGRDMELDPDGIASPFYGRDQILTGMFGEELRDIDAALTRLESDAYGRCTRCAQTIPQRRLQALPAAELCVTCQSNADRHAIHAGGRTHAA
jgi:RNA polymerase-binding transcription factor DksA